MALSSEAKKPKLAENAKHSAQYIQPGAPWQNSTRKPEYQFGTRTAGQRVLSSLFPNSINGWENITNKGLIVHSPDFLRQLYARQTTRKRLTVQIRISSFSDDHKAVYESEKNKKCRKDATNLIRKIT